MSFAFPPPFHKINRELPSSHNLWSGRLGGVEDPHSDLQLARGFLPFCRRRGTCEVRGRSANLWYAAAKALGFNVVTARYPDGNFIAQVTTLCPGITSLVASPGRLRRPSRLPDIVFSDSGSFPMGEASHKYWDIWTVPHLFYGLGVDDDGERASTIGWDSRIRRHTTALPPPPGWTSHSVCLSHRDTRGRTSGRWTFCVWYPLDAPAVSLCCGDRGGGPPSSVALTTANVPLHMWVCTPRQLPEML